MGFTGKYNHNVDVKNRIIIPSKFRQNLGETVIVYRDSKYHCLSLFESACWDQVADTVTEKAKEEKNKASAMKIFGRVDEADMDKQGRITLSAEALEVANIKNDVIIVGANTHVEVWDSATWIKLQNEEDNETDDQLDELVF